MTQRILAPQRAMTFLLGVFALTGGPAMAGSVVLWPINPSITAEERATALWLENRGNEPVTLQVRALGWSQADGADHYADQDEVVSSPPITTVAPGKRQLIRVVRRSMAAPGKERSYRLLIDELPPPPAQGTIAPPRARLAIQMRYSIPLFTYSEPAAKPAPRLDLRFTAVEGKRFVEIRNTGDQHARLIDLRMKLGSKQFNIFNGLVGYILPGSVMRWPLPAETPLTGNILVNVNGADQQLSPNA